MFFNKIVLARYEKFNFFIKNILIKCIKILRKSFEIKLLVDDYISIFKSTKIIKFKEFIKKLKEDHFTLNINNHIVKISLSMINFVYKSLDNSELDHEDNEIIKQSLKLFNLMIITSENYCSDLMNKILNEYDLKSFFIFGILSSKVKEKKLIFCKNLKKLICALFDSKEYSLVYFLLNLFFKISYEIELLSTYADTFLYFDLFEFIVKKAINNTETNNSYDFTKHALNYSNMIININKFKFKDEIFIGFLKIINIIVVSNPELKSKFGHETNLLYVLTQQYLFKDTKLNIFNTLDNNNTTFELLDKENPSITNENAYYNQEYVKQIYVLLNNLIADDKNNMKTLFSGVLADFPLEIKSINRSNYDPFSEKRSQYNFVGLKNLGCTCYMNSMLQQFFNIPSFRYCLLQINDYQSFKITDEILKYDDNVLHQLQNMFTFLELSDRKYYTPRGFCYAFKDLDGKPTNISVQQDAQEFLGRLFDILEKQIQSTPFKYLLQSVFGGKYCSQLICQGGCGTVRNNIEDFYNLSLEVKNHKTLKESLEKYISEEKIEDYKCDNCKKNVTLIKRNSIAELPNVLIMHLQRILFDYDNLQNNKINSKLEFPTTLNLKEYSTEFVSKSNSEFTKTDKSENSSFLIYEKEESYYEYNLVGVVVHTGSADAGHYYSLINVKRDGYQNEMLYNPINQNDSESWLEFNDSNIYSFDIKNLEEECYGGNNAFVEENSLWLNRHSEQKEKCKNAYILVYERKIKKPIKKLLDKEFIIKEQSSYIEINENNKYEIYKQYDIFNSEFNTETEQSSRKNISDITFYEKEKNEFYSYTPFYKTKKLIPKQFYQEVYIDNLNFLNDQKIFNKNFNEFLNNSMLSLKHMIRDLENNDGSLKPIIITTVKYLIKVLPMSSFKEYLNDIVSSINYILKSFPHLSENILFIILENKENLKDLMFSSEESSNQAYKRFFLNIININLNFKEKDIKNNLFFNCEKNKRETKYSLKEKIAVIELIDIFISWIPNDVSKNWTKMCAFLELFQGLSESGELEVEVLMSREIVYKLIDFFLSKDSPYCKPTENRFEMGSKNISPFFSPLIATIANICKYCYTDKWDEKRIKKGKNPPDVPEGKKFILSSRDRECIILKSFYQKAIKENYCPDAIGKILSHFMFNNLEFTKKRLFLVLEMFNDNFGLLEVKSFLEIFSQILRINDKYSRLRIEYIFGIPQIQVRYSGSIPQFTKYEGKYSDKLIWFYSPILYNTSYLSLTDQIIRFLSHSEILIILSFYFNMIFNNSTAFNYFDNCPSPISENKFLKDYLLDFIEEELQSNFVFINNKNHEHLIQNLKKIRVLYEAVQKEFQNSCNLFNICLKNDYILNKILKETITLETTFNNLMYKNVYVLRLEYDVEIDPSNKNKYENNSVEIDQHNDNDNIKENYSETNKEIDENKNLGKNVISILEEDNSSNNEVGNLEELKIFPESNLFGLENKYLNQEEYYRKLVNNVLLKNPTFTRQLIDNEINPHKCIRKCLKRYLVVNDSDRDHKIKFKFIKKNNTEKPNEYIPDSEIVVTIKRYSVSNAFTMLRINENLPFSELDLQADISYYDFGKDDYFSYNIFQDNNSKKTKQIRNDYQLLTNPTESSLHSNLSLRENKSSGLQEDQNININTHKEPEKMSNDFFTLDCSHCKQTNYFNNNCMTYLCSYCQRDPFE